jgi:hypothetical protein
MNYQSPTNLYRIGNTLAAMEDRAADPQQAFEDSQDAKQKESRDMIDEVSKSSDFKAFVKAVTE